MLIPKIAESYLFIPLADTAGSSILLCPSFVIPASLLWGGLQDHANGMMLNFYFHLKY